MSCSSEWWPWATALARSGPPSVRRSEQGISLARWWGVHEPDVSGWLVALQGSQNILSCETHSFRFHFLLIQTIHLGPLAPKRPQDLIRVAACSAFGP